MPILLRKRSESSNIHRSAEDIQIAKSGFRIFFYIDSYSCDVIFLRRYLSREEIKDSLYYVTKSNDVEAIRFLVNRDTSPLSII